MKLPNREHCTPIKAVRMLPPYYDPETNLPSIAFTTERGDTLRGPVFDKELAREVNGTIEVGEVSDGYDRLRTPVFRILYGPPPEDDERFKGMDQIIFGVDAIPNSKLPVHNAVEVEFKKKAPLVIRVTGSGSYFVESRPGGWSHEGSLNVLRWLDSLSGKVLSVGDTSPEGCKVTSVEGNVIQLTTPRASSKKSRMHLSEF